MDDGFRKSRERDLLYKYSASQNIFFIHGAFHIKKSNYKIYKITQTSEKALYTKIEEAISNEEEIICVFRHDNKIDEITENEYLHKTYEKLVTLQGSLVIIGCSLSENDKHVFKQIENSNIDTVYISSKVTKEKDVEKQKNIINEDYEKAKKYFNTKHVVLFDAEIISYEKPKDLQPNP